MSDKFAYPYYARYNDSNLLVVFTAKGYATVIESDFGYSIGYQTHWAEDIFTPVQSHLSVKPNTSVRDLCQ